MSEEPLRIKFRTVDPPPPTELPEEKLLGKLQFIEEKQDRKAEALQKISEVLIAFDRNDSEIERLTFDVLALLKKRLEEGST